MRRSCAFCRADLLVAREIDNHIRIVDAEPVPDGELVLKFYGPDQEPTAFWSVDPDGDEFFDIPAGAPRYRRHECKGGRG